MDTLLFVALSPFVSSVLAAIGMVLVALFVVVGNSGLSSFSLAVVAATALLLAAIVVSIRGLPHS
jgi:hypothetical protein